jgi:hypothetical protein
MQLVNTTTVLRKLFISILLSLPLLSLAQENSPYSRYGLGNYVPAGNIVNRSMGGIVAAYADSGTFYSPAVLNFVNPASYGSLTVTTFDIAAEADTRKIKEQSTGNSFSSTNAIVSYMQVGIPLLSGNKKAQRKGINWGMSFGLRPLTKVNYKIEQDSRVAGIDSLVTTYEGTGGGNQAFLGTAIKIRNFSLGFNTGFIFGNKSYETRLEFINDSVKYQSSRTSSKTSYSGLFFDIGAQYIIPLRKHQSLTFGAYGNLAESIKASRDISAETVSYSASGSIVTLDSIRTIKDTRGTIRIPATFGGGMIYSTPNFLGGLDFETTLWDNYREYGAKDAVKNSWTMKGGVQFYPATISSTKYLNFVKYRIGAYYGHDYIAVDNTLPEYGFTAGLGLPLKLRKAFYESQSSVLNIGFEYGSRGNKLNNIRENITRISLGFTLSDRWFKRYKYD